MTLELLNLSFLRRLQSSTNPSRMMGIQGEIEKEAEEVETTEMEVIETLGTRRETERISTKEMIGMISMTDRVEEVMTGIVQKCP